VRVAGQTIHPVEVDLIAVQWPLLNGMGVYIVYYDQNATDLDVIDLTPYVQWEDGDATVLEVGAPSWTL